MELNNTTPATSSISRSETYPLYKDYNALIEWGYELIARYSGAIWTNYNTSDPGITILQNLCYALTELGHKADLPVNDILTDKNGDIAYDDHFHTPQQIFPVNPVTANDFSKVILNTIPELKQVYITSADSFPGSVFIRTALEVKPEYAGKVYEDISFIPFLCRKAATLLHEHCNLTQLFVTPRVLSPVMVRITGTLSISNGFRVEEVLADLIYHGNNYLSPYPVYGNYQQLVYGGKSLAELLEGPYLTGGYIDDSNIVMKREQLTSDELGAVLLTVQGVQNVSLSGISLNDSAYKASIGFAFDEVPFISIDSFSTTRILLNGKQVTDISIDKVNYYLNQLIPVQQPGDLNELLPKGEYRDIERYYSIQHSFPAAYQLAEKASADPAREAKIRQLKAYLVLFEQLMADYLAQLKNTSNLFSFESGRTDFQLTSASYFTQPLYEVPGIERVLTGVKGYSSLHATTPSDTDWKAYSEDPDNPYARQLVSGSTAITDDLSRKLRAMEHLLARCGKGYDHQPLRLTNPQYGSDLIAEVEYLKQTLQHFPLLSANRARSYFRTDESSFLVTGLELNLENELGIRSFYNGMVEAINYSLLNHAGLDIIYYDDAGAHIIYPAGEEAVEDDEDAGKNGLVEVLQNDHVLFAFLPEKTPPLSMNGAQARAYLQPYTNVLATLSAQFYGFILIDHCRLATFLRFKWMLKAEDGGAMYVSDEMSVNRLAQQIALMDSPLPLQVKSVGNRNEFEIGVKSEKQWYQVCDGINSEAEARAIMSRLQHHRINPSEKPLTIEVTDNSSNSSIPADILFGRVTVLFPEWVSLYQQKSYRELLGREILALSPASSVCEVLFVPVTTFQEVFSHYRNWMKGLEELYLGKRPSEDSHGAAFKILNILSKSHEKQ